MCELFVSVAGLKREKKQTICQSRKEKYRKKKVEKKGSEEEKGGGGHDMLSQKIEIIQPLKPTSLTPLPLLFFNTKYFNKHTKREGKRFKEKLKKITLFIYLVD